MKDRLQQLMKLEGLTAAKIAEIAEVQPSAVSHMLSGRNNPGYDFICKILGAFPKLNARWFILGEQPVYNDSPLSAGHSLFTNEHNVPNKNQEDHNIDTKNNVMSNLKLDEINSQIQQRRVEKIVFFYTDDTFKVYAN